MRTLGIAAKAAGKTQSVLFNAINSPLSSIAATTCHRVRSQTSDRLKDAITIELCRRINDPKEYQVGAECRSEC